jgi:hypothetical protein
MSLTIRQSPMDNYIQKNISDSQGLLYITDIQMEDFTIERFIDVFKDKFDESDFKTFADLARASKTSKQNISRILTFRRHADTGAPPTLTRPTVLKWAKALNWNEKEALELAGLGIGEPEAEKSKIYTEIEYLVEQLPDNRQNDLLNIAKLFLKDKKNVTEVSSKENVRNKDPRILRETPEKERKKD